MRFDRLRNVVRAIEEAKWEDNPSVPPPRYDQTRFATACGTPGCALGHYASRPDLQSRFTLDNGVIHSHYGGRARVPIGTAHVVDHFEIDHLQELQLFGVEGCEGQETTREQAVMYIEAFIAKHEAVEAVTAPQQEVLV